MCIPRHDMPQVDQADLPSLFAFLSGKGIMISEHYYPPSWLVMMQCPEEVRRCRNPDYAKKPILISMGLEILDGNHRCQSYLEDGAKLAWCLKIGLEFDAARRAILEFPKAYRFDGDDALSSRRF